MVLQDLEYLNKIAAVVCRADIRDLIEVINDDLFVFVKKLENIVVVIIERVAVDLCFQTKIRDGNGGEFLGL